MSDRVNQPLIAIACGGTGGHLFPGLAVAGELKQRGCDVLLLVSPKDVDQQAVKQITQMTVATLPAVGLTRGNVFRFLAGFGKSYFTARNLFRQRAPQGVLAMGGFTSAPPVLAGRACGAAAFLHESNSVPGRANRWLARWVNQAYVGFPQAAERLRCRDVVKTGTPVRPGFLHPDHAASRKALGFDPQRPVLLITGGSQGAHAINRLMMDALPLLAAGLPQLQFLHGCGGRDEAEVKAAYARQPVKAVVRGFVTEMNLALGAATLAVSRAGASSLAELAAVRLPALLIPYPSAADNHQHFNALAFADTGAAVLKEQSEATAENVAEQLLALLQDDTQRQAMSESLILWESPRAAQLIVENMLHRLKATGLLPANLLTIPSASHSMRHTPPHSSFVTAALWTPWRLCSWLRPSVVREAS